MMGAETEGNEGPSPQTPHHASVHFQGVHVMAKPDISGVRELLTAD